MEKIRFWCYKILPLVYDSSLSYYELLCKVIEKVNEMISVTTEMQDHISEEVELIMQKWVEDGTLQEIINTEIFDGLNDRVGALETNVSDLDGEVSDINTALGTINETIAGLDDTITELEDKFYLFQDYVTPEDYGAKGDGVTDDTAAVQAAMDDGRNIRLLTTSHYRVTDTLIFKDIDRVGWNMFSFAATIRPTVTNIIVDFSETKPLFKLQDDGIVFRDIYVHGSGDHSYNFMESDRNAADIDVHLYGCCLSNFARIGVITGRGCTIENCVISDCNRLLDIYWSGEGDTAWHDDATGHRAFIIRNNRFHSVKSRIALVNVFSGNTFGMEIAGNIMDRGVSSLLHATVSVDSVRIADNQFIGVRGHGTNDAFIMFDAGATNCQINNNHFIMVESDSAAYAHHIIESGGTLTNCQINNNQCNFINNGEMIVTTGLSGCTVNSNQIGYIWGPTTSARGLIRCYNGGHIDNSVIASNYVGADSGAANDTWIAIMQGGSSGSTIMSGTKIIGNMCDRDVNSSQISKAHTADTTTNCLFDWDLLA